MAYGLGTLYLTTIASTSQSVYVFPSNFANITESIGDGFKIAFGVIPQDHIVRDMCVVSRMLQPLPGDCIHIYIRTYTWDFMIIKHDYIHLLYVCVYN